MVEAVTSMKTNSSPQALDSPPPLPREATRRPGSNLMGAPPQAVGGMGAEASDPLVQTLMLTKQIENAAQQLAALNPQMAGPISTVLNAFRQISANGLAAQVPELGAGGGMAAPPPMPMPPQMPPGGMQ